MPLKPSFQPTRYMDMGSLTEINKTHDNGQKGTPYLDLPEDHDLSPEEQKIRQALKESFHTVEATAQALGIDPERIEQLEQPVFS